MSDYGQEARQVELDGISQLSNYFGDNAKIIELGHTGGHDFEIYYLDGRKAIGEFSWLAEPTSYEMWKAIVKRDEPQQIQLPNGLGYWGIALNKPINIKVLENLAPGWIVEILATGADHIEIQESWPNDALSRKLREFGVSRIHKHSDEFDKILFMVMGKAGAVPSDLVPLRDSISHLLKNNEKVRSNCLKLIGVESDEKHVYLRLGELVPHLETWALWKVREPVVIPEIEFPEAISHLWLESGSKEIRNILWESERKPKYF